MVPPAAGASIDWAAAYEGARQWVIEAAGSRPPAAVAAIQQTGCAHWMQYRDPGGAGARTFPPGVMGRGPAPRSPDLVYILVEMVVRREGGQAS